VHKTELDKTHSVKDEFFFSFLFYSVRLAPSDGYILSQSHTYDEVYECLLFLMIIIIIDFLGKRHATACFHKHIFLP